MKITCILLAAGQSQRFGCNKLLSKINNHTSIGQASLQSALNIADDLIVVLSPDTPELKKLFECEDVKTIVCPDAHKGMGSSLAFAIENSLSADGWIIMLADMPFIKRRTIELVVNELKENKANICAPCYGKKRGHPVGFSRKYKTALLRLKDDLGAKIIIENNLNSVTNINCDDPGILADIDVPADLEKYQTNAG